MHKSLSYVTFVCHFTYHFILTVFNMYKSLVILLLFLSGCGGGLNCPIDPPNCCYNALFGCGPFDLQFGCECADYGLSVPEISYSRVNEAAAIWFAKLTQEKSSCLAAPKKISGNLKITESKRSVRIEVPGYGVLHGKGSAKLGYKLSGQYKIPLSTCSAKITGAYKKNSSNRAMLNTVVSYTCLFAPTCQTSYRGMLDRVG
jgi:hypothetical protein